MQEYNFPEKQNIRTLFMALRSSGHFKKYVKNFCRAHNCKKNEFLDTFICAYYNWYARSSSNFISNLLNSAMVSFTWSTTDEGSAYWHNVFEILSGKYKEHFRKYKEQRKNK